MKTSIAWTELSWNPFVAYNRDTGKRGWFCVKVSEGCTNCYASRRNRWIGTGHNYRLPDLEKVRIEVDEATLRLPLTWKEPSRIFVCSMTDLFFEGHSDEQIARVVAVMLEAAHHVFQVLTKRPERMARFFNEFWPTWSNNLPLRFLGVRLTFPNVHFGISAENQERYDERLGLLLDTPATVRWISYEPALGPIYFRLDSFLVMGKINWIVVGGESGSRRGFDLEWARSTIGQCADAGVAVFVKQLGSVYARAHKLTNKKGEDLAEWPEDLRVRQYPGDIAQ